MKKLLFGAILLFSVLGFSQNDTINNNKREVTVEIPKTEFDEYIEKHKTLDEYLYETDAFSGDKTYYSFGKPITFTKIKRKNGSLQYVSIHLLGSTLNYGCSGVYILFENGQKIIRENEKVSTGYSNGYDYSAFFTPTASEIKLLKTQRVTDIKLYIYDTHVEEYGKYDADEIRYDAQIMLTSSVVKKKK